MKKNFIFILILSTLICAVSCTDRVHMNDIKDEYAREIHICYLGEDRGKIESVYLSAYQVTLEDMLELIEEHNVGNGNPYLFYPREGKFETANGEKFISAVGHCNIYLTSQNTGRIWFTLRIFDKRGYLIVEDIVEVWLGAAKKDIKDIDDANWSLLDPEILEYWKIIAVASN